MNLIIICASFFLFTLLIIKIHKLQVELIATTKQIDIFITDKTNAQQKILKYETEIKEYNNIIESVTTASNEFISEMKNDFNSTLKLTEQKHDSQMKTKDLEHSKNLKKTIETTRKETLKKSRAVIRGQATEHLAPFILKGTNPKDYRFLGNPIDYIHFEGLSNIIDGTSDEITSVNFIDIKTGNSSLSKNQRRIRDAIQENRVQFLTINLDKEIEKQNGKIKDEHSTSSLEES
tara:strand:+ start:13892 stop:14593 length:702 start_codon:yes stop_codon:yes gene_type:complete